MLYPEQVSGGLAAPFPICTKQGLFSKEGSMTQQQRLKTQVLVIGAGISGSTSALTLADAGYEVTLIVPGKELDGGNSALAQGVSNLLLTMKK